MPHAIAACPHRLTPVAARPGGRRAGAAPPLTARAGPNATLGGLPGRTVAAVAPSRRGAPAAALPVGRRAAFAALLSGAESLASLAATGAAAGAAAAAGALAAPPAPVAGGMAAAARGGAIAAAAAAAGGSAATAGDVTAADVTVVTYNVRGVMDRWPERAPLLRGCLARLGADVLCFQEVLTGEACLAGGV
jgi:hypothetical protein